MGLFLVLSTTHGESPMSWTRTWRRGDKEPPDQLDSDFEGTRPGVIRSEVRNRREKTRTNLAEPLRPQGAEGDSDQ